MANKFELPEIEFSDEAWNYIKWGIILLAVILVVVFFTSALKSIKKLFGLGSGKAQSVWEPSPYVPDGGTVALDFDATPYVSRLKAVILDKNYFAKLMGSDLCNISRRIIEELNDNEFIAVVNSYNLTNSRDLRTDIENMPSGCSIFFTNWVKEVYNRMDKLNMNG